MSSVLARSVLASHLLASAQMMLPDLTQQAEALPMPIAAASVANAWALTRPFLGPFLIFDYIFQFSHATAAQTLLLCKEPIQSRDGGTDFASVQGAHSTQRSGRAVYASWIVSAGRGVLDEHVHRASSSRMLM